MWPDWFQAAGLTAADGQRRIVLDDSNVRIQAAVDGLGVVLADHLAEAEIASGKLVVPIATAVGGSGYYLLTRGEPAPPVAAFIRWLIAQA